MTQSLLSKMCEILSLSPEEKRDALKKFECADAVEVSVTILENLKEDQKKMVQEKIEKLKNSPLELTAFFECLIKINPELKEKVDQSTERVMNNFMVAFLKSASEEEKDKLEEWFKEKTSLSVTP